MSCPNQNVFGSYAVDRGSHPVAEQRGEAKKIRADDRDPQAVLLEYERAHRQFALLARDRMRGPHTSADRQQRVGGDVSDRNAGAESSGDIKHGHSRANQEREQFKGHGGGS